MLAAVRHGALVSRLIRSVSPVPVIPSKPVIRTNASRVFAGRGSVTHSNVPPVLANHALVRRGGSVITAPVTLYKTSIFVRYKDSLSFIYPANAAASHYEQQQAAPR